MRETEEREREGKKELMEEQEGWEAETGKM